MVSLYNGSRNVTSNGYNYFLNIRTKLWNKFIFHIFVKNLLCTSLEVKFRYRPIRLFVGKNQAVQGHMSFVEYWLFVYLVVISFGDCPRWSRNSYFLTLLPLMKNKSIQIYIPEVYSVNTINPRYRNYKKISVSKRYLVNGSIIVHHT